MRRRHLPRGMRETAVRRGRKRGAGRGRPARLAQRRCPGRGRRGVDVGPEDHRRPLREAGGRRRHYLDFGVRRAARNGGVG